MNEYFQVGAVPAPSSPGASSVMRQEFANIAAGFDKLPVMAGHGGALVTINSTGTGMETTGFVVDDIVTLTGTQELTNKTISWADNAFPGFGDAATKNVGSGIGDVVMLLEANKLPGLDAGNLSNIPGLDLKADVNNAILTGAPVCPTPPGGDVSARIANTQFVSDTMQALGNFGPSNATPLMDGVGSSGFSATGSRSDHVHPVDTSRAPAAASSAAGTSFTPAGNIAANNVQAAIQELDSEKANLASPVFTGVPAAPTPAGSSNDATLATTAFVQSAIAPLATVASPAFTGNPTAPTPLTSDNDTSIATTAFVQSLVAQQPAGVQPSNSTPLMNGVGAAGSSVDASRSDHVHPVDTSRAAASAATAGGTSFAPAGNIAATDVQAAIQELDAEKATLPTGTRLVFAQASAPTGWTQDTSDNATNRMLRVVNTAGNGVGGSHSPILNDVVPSHTHTMTTGTESVGHTHSANSGNVSADHTHWYDNHAHTINAPYGTPGGAQWGLSPIYQAGYINVFDTNHGGAGNTGGASANHYHSVSTGDRSAAHTHSGTTNNGSSQTNWTPRYINTIICSKD